MVIDQLDRIRPIGAGEICRELRAEAATLAAALRDAAQEIDRKRRLTAAALLLMLNDTAGRELFLEALGGPDGDARDLAIGYLEYELSPCDLDLAWRRRTPCPLSSEEVFEALKRDLHEPWTGISVKVLEILCWHDYPQARSVTRGLLSHRDATLRRRIAESYLRAGRDEGAFAVLEKLLRQAPACVPHRDPRWHDFYHTKEIWYSIEEAAKRGDDELRSKAASLSMEFVSKALDAPDAKRRFDCNDGLIYAQHAVDAIGAVMPRGAKELLERMMASGA